MIAMGTEGWFRKNLNMIQRVLVIVAGLAALPGFIPLTIGAVCLCFIALKLLGRSGDSNLKAA